MIRKRAMALLGMALLVTLSGCATAGRIATVDRSDAGDAAVTDAPTRIINQAQQDCAEQGGVFVEAAGVCQLQTP